MTGAALNVSDTARRPAATRRRPALTDLDVLDEAERLLGEGGFEALSARRLADALGASRQVVYTHFDGMHGLFDALHQRLSDRLTDAVVTAGDDPGSTDHLLAATAGYRHIARTWPELYQLVFERPVADYRPGVEAVRVSRACFGHVIAGCGAWLDRHGRPGDDGGLALARALMSATHGFMTLERVGLATPAETEELSGRTITALLDGWRR